LLPIPEYLVEFLPRDENSADPRVLARFIRWSATAYPSTYRMLILSGHGSGAVGDFLSDDNARRGQPGSLTIPRLATALDLAQKGDGKKEGDLAEPLPRELLKSPSGSRLLHVLGMDSCLMGMAEVGHQVQDWVDYLVGSEGFVPNAGWPYAHLLKRLKDRRDRTPERVAGWIVEDVLSHYDHYIPAGVSFDMAACDLKKLPDLAEAVKGLTKILGARMDNRDDYIRDLVIVAHWRAQSYKFEQHTDLADFCDQLEQAASRFGKLEELAQLRTACGKVTNAVKAAVDDRKGYCGAEFQHSHGLSVYFPWSASPSEKNALKHYAKMSFPAESGWSDFLKVYLKRTQREGNPRPAERGFFVHRFIRQGPVQAYGPGKAAEGANRAAEGANRFIMKLYSGPGMTLPGSMKNPPEGVWTRPRHLEPRARRSTPAPKGPDKSIEAQQRPH